MECAGHIIGVSEPRMMDTDWIEAVMRINTAIVEAEARLNTKVAELLTLAMEGQDTADAEALLMAQGRSLGLLRATQAQLLQELEAGG
jgi:hypothetical protein